MHMLTKESITAAGRCLEIAISSKPVLYPISVRCGAYSTAEGTGKRLAAGAGPKRSQLRFAMYGDLACRFECSGEWEPNCIAGCTSERKSQYYLKFDQNGRWCQ